MDWSLIITGVVSLIGGGIITRLVTIKSARRKAGAEADNAVVDALNNAIEALNSACGELRTKLSESGAREDNLNARLAERDSKIDDLHKQIADKRCESTTKGYYMCIHQGCNLRCPSLGRGKDYYRQHAGEEDFGADFYTVEELLEHRRQEREGRGAPGQRPPMQPMEDN